MGDTIIAWSDKTWNPSTGCSRVSDGCTNCYAERLSLKFGRSKLPWTLRNAKENVELHPERLDMPRRWRSGARVFVNSMSDLFHAQIPDGFIRQVWDVMLDTPRHTYQILTKRPERVADWPGPWPSHIWQGTSVEDRKALGRIDHLRRCGAAVRFLSCEPLLEDLGAIDLAGIHWVIVGGESGPGYRPMDHAWARSIRDQCDAAGVAFFFKQSSAFMTERGIELIEEDGSKAIRRDYPD